MGRRFRAVEQIAVTLERRRGVVGMAEIGETTADELVTRVAEEGAVTIVDAGEAAGAVGAGDLPRRLMSASSAGSAR